MTDASRKAKERASRKAKGEKRVELWLEPLQLEILDFLRKKNARNASEVVSVLLFHEWLESGDAMLLESEK